MNASPLTGRNWFGKASAGLVCGFLLALALSGLFSHYGPGGYPGESGKLQVTMWLMAPLWALVFSFCFLFRNGLRAWAWLGGATLLAFAPLLFG